MFKLYKSFQRKTGIQADRVVVRPHFPWEYKVIAASTGGILLIFLFWWIYETGSKAAMEPEYELIEQRNDYLFDPGVCRQTKKQVLCSQVGDLMQQLQISSTANRNLAEQVKFLAGENDYLKEKLIFFRHLASGNANDGIMIHQFSLKETQIPGKYRYTLALMQGGNKPADFNGKLRFQLKLKQKGKSKTVPLVGRKTSQDFSINFRLIHWLEDSFRLPPGVGIEHMQVQVFENDDTEPLLTEVALPVL